MVSCVARVEGNQREWALFSEVQRSLFLTACFFQMTSVPFLPKN